MGAEDCAGPISTDCGPQHQVDVDARVESYNAERTHSGKYCCGKTPLQTFIESAPLAHEKQLHRVGHSSDLTTASA